MRLRPKETPPVREFMAYLTWRLCLCNGLKMGLFQKVNSLKENHMFNVCFLTGRCSPSQSLKFLKVSEYHVSSRYQS